MRRHFFPRLDSLAFERLRQTQVLASFCQNCEQKLKLGAPRVVAVENATHRQVVE